MIVRVMCSYVQLYLPFTADTAMTAALKHAPVSALDVITVTSPVIVLCCRIDREQLAV